jgi:hypothetical protein
LEKSLAVGLSVQGPVQDLDGAYERWFAAHECDAFLARPQLTSMTSNSSCYRNETPGGA